MMVASNNDVDGNGTPTSSSTNSSVAPRPPLPLSIAVRNLFPPLALPDDAAADVAVAATTANANGDGADEGSEDRHGTTPSKQRRHQLRIKALAAKIISSSQVDDRCALVSREVLLRLRLDIIAKTAEHQLLPCDGNGSESAENASTNLNGNEILIYSCEHSHCTVHPRWDHINEQIPGRLMDDPTTNVYARFVILNDDDNINTNTPAASSSTDTHNKSSNEWILAEISIHPSKLRRLPLTTDYDDTDNNNNNRNRSSMIIPHSLPPNTIILHYDDGYTRILPNVYWLLVQKGIITENVMDPIKRTGSGGYHDKSTTRRRREGEEEDGGNDEKALLFEDKAFDVLRESVPVFEGEKEDESNIGSDVTKDATSRVGNPPPMYHDDDKVFDLLGKPTTESIDAQMQVVSNTSDVAKKEEESVFDSRILDLVGGGSNNNTEAAAMEDSKGEEPELIPGADMMSNNETHDDMVKPNETSDGMIDTTKSDAALDTMGNHQEEDTPSSLPQPSPPASPPVIVQLPTLPASVTKDKADTNEVEIEELRRLVKMEQQLLDEEQRRIVQGTNHLKYIMQQVQQLEDETLEIMGTVGAERTNLFRSNFRLEAHRIHLLQHLQLIFPIKIVPINLPVNPPNYPQHQFTIASLPVPYDVHSPTVTDDQISTALGFLCHLISLTSKYLAIPMRYTVVCKFSRSAILFDQGRNTRDRGGGINNDNNGKASFSKVVYPLFRERGVIDREQLDYGLMLLERNVDCLLRLRHVEFRTEWNVLAKVDRLLVQVIEGADPSFGGHAG